MEDEPVAPETGTRRSKRARAQVKAADFTRTDKIDVELGDEQEESSEDFQEPRRKFKRNKATEDASTSAAAARKTYLRLIEVIKGEGKEIPDVVKRWVELYERNQKSSMAELLSMLFEACGAKYHLQDEDLDETGVGDVVVALINMARRVELKTINIKVQKGTSRISKITLCISGTIWSVNAKMDHCLISHCLANAWTT